MSTIDHLGTVFRAPRHLRHLGSEEAEHPELLRWHLAAHPRGCGRRPGPQEGESDRTWDEGMNEGN